jgi:hypothetical protein
MGNLLCHALPPQCTVLSHSDMQRAKQPGTGTSETMIQKESFLLVGCECH